MLQEPTPGTFLLLTTHATLATLCIWNYFRERRERRGEAYPWVWILLAIPIFLLGVHHATGLGATLTDTFRQEALHEGWYAARRGLQRQLTLLLFSAGFGVLVGSAWLLRRRWRRYLPAAFAFVLLAGYGALQLISLHDVDARMHSRWLGATLGTWLNTLGLSLAGGSLCWSFKEGWRKDRPRSVSARRTCTSK